MDSAQDPEVLRGYTAPAGAHAVLSDTVCLLSFASTQVHDSDSHYWFPELNSSVRANGGLQGTARVW